MITVLGASGFIGSQIIKKLIFGSLPFYAPSREESIFNKDLGDVIYCIGLTADFRTKPFETINAHICKLNEVLSKCSFNSLTYLSSTRVYINSTQPIAYEDDKLLIDVMDADDLYTLSKLTGERLCLSSGKQTKIIRLSNVVGKDDSNINFLSSIINTIKKEKAVLLQQSLSSSKDFVFIDDVVDAILKIVFSGKHQLYNVASGQNTTNESILVELQKYFNYNFSVKEPSTEKVFPNISIQKICSEFNFRPKGFSEQLSLII